MAFAYALDPTTPAGGEAASLGDDRIREFKNAMIERILSRFVNQDSDPWIIKSPSSGGNTQSLVPITDNLYTLGTGALRFADLRSVTATFSTFTLSGLTASLAVFTDASKNLVSNTITGTGSVVMSASPTLTGTANFATIVATGDITGANHKLGGSSGLLGYASNNVSINNSSDTITLNTTANTTRVTITASNFTVDHAGTTSVTLGNSTTNGVNRITMLNGGTHLAWRIASQDHIDGGLEFTPSTAVGGTTFNTPSLVIRAADMYIPAANKFYLDGGGDTYIYESSANNLVATVGGSTAWAADTSLFAAGSSRDFAISATKKLYLDGGVDTYVTESSNNIIRFVAGTVNSLEVRSDFIVVGSIPVTIQAAQKVYLDGAGDTYIWEASANNVQITAGGSLAAAFTATAIAIAATNRLYLDGGSDTYILESSANVWRVVAGGSTSLTTTASTVEIPSGNKLYVDGGGDTYIYESSANNMRFVAGGTTALDLNGTSFALGIDFSVAATKKIYLDGGGDTYMVEASANNVELRAGGTVAIAYNDTTIAIVSGTAVTTANLQQTASGSNVVRATSSMLVKDRIENLTMEEARHVIFGLRATKFYSLCEADDPNSQYVGVILEEILKLDARFVVGESVQFNSIIAANALITQDHEMRIRKLEGNNAPLVDSAPVSV